MPRSKKFKKCLILHASMTLKKIFSYFLIVVCLSQISILALMCIVHGLECARHTVRMTPAVSVLNNVPPIRIQCALRMEQHTTTNAGMSQVTVEDWKTTLCIIQEVVKVRTILYNNTLHKSLTEDHMIQLHSLLW